jgi:ATP-dependent Clp protease ATP-binding subunit ClpA
MFEDPELHAALSALDPEGRRALEAAREFALGLHAEELGPEHLLSALMADEEGAAHRAVEHAFADPETIAAETLAMASGILVSGSAASMPFSPGGVRALEVARGLAAEREDGAVREAHLLLASVRALPPEDARGLAEAGWREDALFELAAGSGRVAPEGSLFRQFTEEAKRTLSAAAQGARQDGAASIGPAHLLIACLTRNTELPRAAGLSAPRARSVLRGRTHDDSRPEPRALAADQALSGLLRSLPPGAGGLALLGAFHAGSTPELANLLERHRGTPALVERLRPTLG